MTTGPDVPVDVQLDDGRTLRAYDSGYPANGYPANGADSTGGLTVVWHHGSPQTGALLPPLLSAAAARGIRLVSYARPSYGGSTPLPGRDVASAATDVAAVADALEIDRCAVIGASGGGPHALACAARLPDRVTGAVCLASIAPLTDDFDWFAGMADDSGLRAATAGRAARQAYAETAEFDPTSFTEADWAALSGAWSALGRDAGRAGTAYPDGLIDDDVAFTADWGFDPADVGVPVLLVQGGEDRVVPPGHADWLLRRLPQSELWLRPRAGHVSVLDACAVAMDWLRELPT